ncbi:sugar diacid recognition domain-containing protein [Niallia sp. NCCP-28]|uniref:CdaR family transcriptional regulator n=1 Tax=Niallia sp. NCCP-28 TaxID=2934712 RepID=UPI00208C2936|nr:sugar diacid recognition domain-containing protein [Niallia sp. NCCP-28]GKU83255.1 carbohydrate diacid regulator [Niallia sp. NCCP-28]
MLQSLLAKNIILEVKKCLNEDLIITDVNGIIIASTNESRIGSFHEGALICSHKQTKIIITNKDQKILKGVKSGINLPVFFKQQIIGVIGITGDPSNVSPYGEIIQKMTELLVKESYYSEQLEREARTLEAFVFDWVQPKEWSETFQNQAELLNIDLHTDRQVIICHYLSSTKDLMQTNILQDIQQTFKMTANDIFVRWGNQHFVLLHATNKKDNKGRILHFLEQLQTYLQEKYALSTTFGIGQTSFPHHVFQSFKQAERALIVAQKTNSIIFDDQLLLEMCLQDIKKETRIEFVNRTIKNIIKDAELLSTLQTFLSENQSFKRTAQKLHIHINTLHYRLKRIEELTKLNPKDLQNLTTLYLAIQFLDDYLKNVK